MGTLLSMIIASNKVRLVLRPSRVSQRAFAICLPLFACACFILFLSGCSSTAGNASSTKAIRQITLIAAPVALDLDGIPGPEGVGIKMHAFTAGSPKSVAIREGYVELFAYDRRGVLEQPPRPFHQWTFEVSDLEVVRSDAVLGPGYDLLLDWRPKVVVSSRIAVVARYHPPNGPPVTSAPSAVTA